MNITSNISLPMLSQYARRGWLQDKTERKAAYDAALQMEVRVNNIWQLARELPANDQVSHRRPVDVDDVYVK
jgi:ABC-type sugar transport system ATPase subunit